MSAAGLRGAAKLPVFLLLLASCGDGGYAISIRFEPADLATQADVVSVYLVRSCPDEAAIGTPPSDPARSVDVHRGEDAAPLGHTEGGHYALQAIARSEACAVVAAGCQAVTLESGGEGTLAVVVRAFYPSSQEAVRRQGRPVLRGAAPP